MRLNKYIAEHSQYSRRKADQLITSGAVKINGQVCKVLATFINAEKDIVEVEGKLLGEKSAKIIYLLNKPKGVVTTSDDPHGRKTVLQLVPKNPKVFACGRLDAETMGLVILTNDGNLCYQLTHPKFEHEKEYLVEGRCTAPQIAVKRLLSGVRLKDGPAKADKVEILKASGNIIKLLVTIHEGRNHLVRRLCGAVNIELLHLTRLRVGHYELGDLAPGKYKTAE